jgi:hypothetical protein
MYPIPPLVPDLDELQAWIAGEAEMGPLTEDERARIEEIESIRFAAQRDAGARRAWGR